LPAIIQKLWVPARVAPTKGNNPKNLLISRILGNRIGDPKCPLEYKKDLCATKINCAFIKKLNDFSYAKVFETKLTVK
jgi:hypothetical protein